MPTLNLRKLLATFMALLLALQPLYASAADLDRAFRSLLGTGAVAAVNEPGFYQSAARNSFIAGGLDIRLPRNDAGMPRLYSFTPPRISAGCGGISAHFGGMSFISGEEMVQVLRNIASGVAMAFVVQLVMSTICAKCQDIVADLKDSLQQASKWAIDSCRLGQTWAKQFASSLGGGGNSGGTAAAPSTQPQEICARQEGSSGGVMDQIRGMFSSSCSSFTRALETLRRHHDPNDPNSQRSVACTTQTGNTTWMLLTTFDRAGRGDLMVDSGARARKLLLMNLLGTTVTSTSPSGERLGGCTVEGQAAVPEEGKTLFCAPRITGTQAAGLLMCGAPDGNGQFLNGANPARPLPAKLQRFCQAYFENREGQPFAMPQLFDCDNNNYATCPSISTRPAGAGLMTGTGFLGSVHHLMHEGAQRVRNNQALEADETGMNVLRLMQIAPVPLYQVLNAAAVYPVASQDLITSISVLIAEQIATAYFDDLVRLPGRAADPNSAGCLSEGSARAMLELLSQMRHHAGQMRTLIGQNITIQEALSEQIRRVNLAIQRQVMSQDMLVAGQYAQNMSRILAEGGARGAPAPAP
jgi:hypothetical protein